jgi:hypothetical protein
MTTNILAQMLLIQTDGLSDLALRQVGTLLLRQFWLYPRAIISTICSYVFDTNIPIIHSGPPRNPVEDRRKNEKWASTMVLPSYASSVWASISDIFVHIPKTAGLSIRDVLCHPYDTYTYLEYVARMLVTNKFIYYGSHVFARYYPVSQRHKLKTIVRNPYDRLVSAYFWMIAGGFYQNNEYNEIKNRYKSFDDWVLNGLEPRHIVWSVENFVMEPIMLQYSWVTDDAQQLILSRENIGRYENLEHDVQRLFNHSTPLPKINRSKHVNWQFYYSNPLVRQKVSSLYRSDFELFQYPTTIDPHPDHISTN